MSEWKEAEFGKVPISWSVLKFSEALKIKGRIGWKGYKTSDLRESGPVVVGGVNIKSNINLDYSSISFLSREKYEESPEIMLKKGDVILVTRGNGIGDVGLFNGEYEEATINPSVVILTEFKGDSQFLYYFLASPQGHDHIMALEGGSSIPALYQGLLKSLELPIPDLPEQKAIASILSSFDDKIDLLHRQNTTLEKMAETLFRQWFVEEAKEEWEEGTLDDILSIKGGTTPSTEIKEYWGGNIHWTSPRDITTLDGIFLFDTERKITELGLQKIGSGLLPSGTLLMSSRAPVGVLAFAEVPLAINQGYIAILDDKGFSKEFIYLWLKENMETVQSYANGSTFLEISKSAFKTLQISKPPKELLKTFQSQVESLFNKIKSNQTQIRTLTTLRDTLLPKLMSGEVRVAAGKN